MPSPTTPGPVVVVLQVQHPTSTPSTVAPPTTTTLDPPSTTAVPLAHPASPGPPPGSLPITGAPLVLEVGTAMILLLAGAITALAARRRRAALATGDRRRRTARVRTGDRPGP